MDPELVTCEYPTFTGFGYVLYDVYIYLNSLPHIIY